MALSDNPNRNFKPSNKHIYVMAGSGAGKTFNFLRTNVMQLNGSMVFTDPKGENFKIFANFLTKHGYKVRVLNLREEEAMYASNTYNPMKYVHNMTDVSVIIDMFIKNTNSPESSKNGDFFEKAERMLYSALLGYLYFQYGKRGLMNDCTIPNLLDLLIMAQTKDKPKSPLDIIFLVRLKRTAIMALSEDLLMNTMVTVQPLCKVKNGRLLPHMKALSLQQALLKQWLPLLLAALFA